MPDYKWDRRFLDIAKQVSTWSKDPRKQVGAVIVGPRKNIVSTGFNGFPAKCRDSLYIYNDKEQKLKQIIHAEVNAILLSRTNVEGHTMYVYPPAAGPSCSHCATIIIQSGISRVVYYHLPNNSIESSWTESSTLGLGLFEEAGVIVESYEYHPFSNV